MEMRLKYRKIKAVISTANLSEYLENIIACIEKSKYSNRKKQKIIVLEESKDTRNRELATVTITLKDAIISA